MLLVTDAGIRRRPNNLAQVQNLSALGEQKLGQMEQSIGQTPPELSFTSSSQTKEIKRPDRTGPFQNR